MHYRNLCPANDNRQVEVKANGATTLHYNRQWLFSASQGRGKHDSILMSPALAAFRQIAGVTGLGSNQRACSEKRDPTNRGLLRPTSRFKTYPMVERQVEFQYGHPYVAWNALDYKDITARVEPLTCQSLHLDTNLSINMQERAASQRPACESNDRRNEAKYGWLQPGR